MVFLFHIYMDENLFGRQHKRYFLGQFGPGASRLQREPFALEATNVRGVIRSQRRVSNMSKHLH